MGDLNKWKKRENVDQIIKKGQRVRIANRKETNSDYFLEAAENMMETDTPEAAVVLGFFAAENKVEQALALKGFKVDSHEAAIKSLFHVLDMEGLGRKLQRAHNERKHTNYEIELGKDSERTENYIENRVKPVIKGIDNTLKD